MEKWFTLGAKAKVSQCLGPWKAELQLWALGSLQPSRLCPCPLSLQAPISLMPRPWGCVTGSSLIQFRFVWVCPAVTWKRQDESFFQQTMTQMNGVSPLSSPATATCPSCELPEPWVESSTPLLYHACDDSPCIHLSLPLD